MHKKLTTSQFVSKAKQIHNEKYNYDKAVYAGNKNKLEIVCAFHGSFYQIPNNHLSGNGCPKCAKIRQNDNTRKTTEQFIHEANVVHNNQYIYSDVNYTRTSNLVDIICDKHGTFTQTPNNHLRGAGCPSCARRPYSKIAVRWLRGISNTENINIRHAENGGEFNIPGTNFLADGFCEDTNTVYEFHGDAFHGNPTLFSNDDRCHPFDKSITASDLLNSTNKKEQKIRSLDFNLVTIWENDYTKLINTK